MYIIHMCVRLQHVKSLRGPHPSAYYIPCGKCADCRKREQNSWLFRLKAEISILPKDSWYGVFFTLTYNDGHIPHIPKILCKERMKETAMCFSKKHIRSFIEEIRKLCEKQYGCVYGDAIRYIICSEFGERTQRSHYHGIILLPKRVSADWLFELVHSTWSENGFVFPKDIKGGEDSHGYKHKPFVIDDLEKASSYVSKYISKDIAYMTKINLKYYKKQHVVKEAGSFQTRYYRYRGLLYKKLVATNGEVIKKDKKVRLSDYLPFHFQSRSLGKGYVDDLLKKEDDVILDKLEKGQFFGFEKFARPLPRYIVNKLIYGVRYGKKQEKRVIRYYGNLFFEKNFRKIFEIKVNQMVQRVTPFAKTSLAHVVDICRNVLAYNGVETQFYEPDKALFWSKRYEIDSYFENGLEYVTYDLPKNTLTPTELSEVIRCLNEYKLIMDEVNKNELANAQIRETTTRISNYIIDSLRSNI